MRQIRIALFSLTIFMVISQRTSAQQYYTNEAGSASINFISSGALITAHSDNVEIIYNQKTETIWLTFQVASFQTGNNKLDKKLFRKNEAEFVIKGNVSAKNILYEEPHFKQFSFIGRVFNDLESGPITAAVRFDFASDDHELNLTLASGVEPRWFGENFHKYAGFPIVNVYLEATLYPISASTSRSGD